MQGSKRVDAVVGLGLGTALRDTDLMRQSYAEVLGENDREMRIISGLLSLLTDNWSEQVHIRKFARFIDAHAPTALALVYLRMPDRTLLATAVRALAPLPAPKARLFVDILSVRNRLFTQLHSLATPLGL